MNSCFLNFFTHFGFMTASFLKAYILSSFNSVSVQHVGFLVYMYPVMDEKAFGIDLGLQRWRILTKAGL